MRKLEVYCDLCKKKIEDSKHNFLWKTGFVKLEFSQVGFISENELEYTDICRECAEKIKIFIETLKK